MMVWRVMARDLVVVAQVGVEVAGQPVLGVVREQPQHHLQAAAAGLQQRDFGFSGPMTFILWQILNDPLPSSHIEKLLKRSFSSIAVACERL